MNRSRLTGSRLIAIFLLGCVLLNYPLLPLFGGGATIFGMPLLYAYVFTVWAGLIILMAIVIERSD
ncbi:MAG TPA: hypothetical protein VMV91_07500 [Rhodocyclaceae bacterium]|nr:hypothetical protein [Rhodocyclaceae bacterium]